jgi:2-polyprenyl-3-methyl-5-hydroxy-6-metoxy-1,4-benzoquinol methylase
VDNGYRAKLFSNYYRSHVSHLDSSDNRPKLEWFRKYVQSNYLPFLESFPRSETKILEIGCNQGFLISALTSLGFRTLKGIDLSPDDIEVARRLVPDAEVLCEDAESHLERHIDAYDCIILKAVLEHISKEKVISFLERIRNSLKQDGMVIIDVPNMDWLMAQHERYMDFTHEIGFTRESLAQVMRNVFKEVQVTKGRAVESRKVELVRPLVLRCLNLVFRIIGEGSSELWWDCRSIIAVARK